MVVIKVDRAITQFDSESLSEMYAKQVERGVLVLGKGDNLALIQEALPEIIVEGTDE